MEKTRVTRQRQFLEDWNPLQLVQDIFSNIHNKLNNSKGMDVVRDSMISLSSTAQPKLSSKKKLLPEELRCTNKTLLVSEETERDEIYLESVIDESDEETSSLVISNITESCLNDVIPSETE